MYKLEHVWRSRCLYWLITVSPSLCRLCGALKWGIDPHYRVKSIQQWNIERVKSPVPHTVCHFWLHTDSD